ncbi:MAG: DUF5320 family protein [Dethiobacteria bacterium]
MPGFDGTGPAGRGTRTGRGRGFCIDRSSATPKFRDDLQSRAIAGRIVRFMGFGPGPGRSLGRGWRRRAPRKD